MSAVTVQDVVDFAMKQAQAEELRTFLLGRLEEAKDRSKFVPAAQAFEALSKRLSQKYAAQ